MREREDANRTREAGPQDGIRGVVAITLNLYRSGAVGFIAWLDVFVLTTLLFKDQPHKTLDISLRSFGQSFLLSISPRQRGCPHVHG